MCRKVSALFENELILVTFVSGNYFKVDVKLYLLQVRKRNMLVTLTFCIALL